MSELPTLNYQDSILKMRSTIAVHLILVLIYK